jgi:TolB-like protein
VEQEGWSFGRWRLYARGRRLMADDAPVPLGSRSFDLLLALVEARGALVGKDELLRRVWPGSIVEENNLQVQVSALRKALGEDAGLIVTIAGRGYRFAGTPEPLAAPPPAASVVAPGEGPPMLVVLPFANLTGDPDQAYFAEGITEDLTMALSQLRWFSVIARASAFTFKGRAVDVREVGRALGVRYVLEGSVRRAANRLRVSAQLSESEAGRQVWAERFDGELTDVFDLQDRLTEAVVGAVEPGLRQAEILRSRARPTGSLSA